MDKLLAVLGLLVAALVGYGCFQIAPAAGLLAGGGVLAVGLLAALGALLRQREIRKLSDYLMRIRQGNYALDIRDNRAGALSILKNDIYKLTLRLSEQAELLRRDKRYLADALADISHQLRTPLTSLSVMTELLADPKLPDSRREEFTTAIQGQIDRIDWLVSSLLKLSKIDAGAITFRRDLVRLRALVERAAAPLLIPIEIREQTLEIDIDPALNIVGDAQWLREAVLNILKNCMEHTPCGGRLRVTARDNPIHTELAIEDSGEGIDPADLPHIFERFYRGKNASPDSAGIGLAMAKAILTGQDGTIEVESTPGRGSRFSLKFYKQIA